MTGVACVGPAVLARTGACTRDPRNVHAWACRAGHEGVARTCDRHGLEVMRGQDATPATVCPVCSAPAWFAIYCGFCRKKQHDRCRAYRGAGRALAGLDPIRAEEFCACTCDPDDVPVPGVRGVYQKHDAGGVA